jgi:hypothetical protein
MLRWLANWIEWQMDILEEILPRVIAGLVIFVVATLPLLILYAGWRMLSGIWRRRERAGCFLALLEIGLQQGRTPEQIFLSMSQQRVADLGPLFEDLAAYLRAGLRLGAALDKVPRLLPASIRAMIQAGEELGDLRRVLPACRATLAEGAGRSHSVFNNIIVLLFVSPVGPALLALLAVWVFPKLQALAADMAGDQLDWSMAWFEVSVLLAKVIFGLWLALWVADALRRQDSWVHRATAPLLEGFLDRLTFRLPWRRKRMQRDFSMMLALLLDGGVPEERALRLAAGSTANSVFRARAERAVADLQQGVKMTEAVRWLDDAGEFRWRLRNAAAPGRGFSAALAGWHETLAAKAFQQEQAVSQVVTTGFVFLNGLMVGLVGVGMFHLFVAIMEEAAL